MQVQACVITRVEVVLQTTTAAYALRIASGNEQFTLATWDHSSADVTVDEYENPSGALVPLQVTETCGSVTWNCPVPPSGELYLFCESFKFPEVSA